MSSEELAAPRSAFEVPPPNHEGPAQAGHAEPFLRACEKVPLGEILGGWPKTSTRPPSHACVAEYPAPRL